jgi:integrase
LHDAVKHYLAENLIEAKGKRGRNSIGAVDRVFARVFEALGSRANVALVDLKREDAYKVRDYMLARDKPGGGKLSPDSVRRELNTVKAVIAAAIIGFDLETRANNPFAKLKIKGESAESDGEKRDPLPTEVVAAMTQRLTEQPERANSALPELRLIWRILQGTGCRLSEVTGLRGDDVETVEGCPHIKVRWNEDSRLKNRVSTRSVPLVGDALAAAKEALKLLREGPAMFPRYGMDGGGDKASANLMKHLRVITEDPKHIIHSLRHNMADLLRLAEVSPRAAKLILGWALGGLDDRVYGGSQADLRLMAEALKKALGEDK